MALKEWWLLGLGPSSVLCLGLLIASFFTLRRRHFLYWFLIFFSRFSSFYLQKNKWSIGVFLVFLLLSLSRPLFSPLFFSGSPFFMLFLSAFFTLFCYFSALFFLLPLFLWRLSQSKRWTPALLFFLFFLSFLSSFMLFFLSLFLLFFLPPLARSLEGFIYSLEYLYLGKI